MEFMTEVKPELVAAIFSCVATFFAAIAAICGPQKAAKLSENLRLSNERMLEKRKLKTYVFFTLMQERAEVYSADAVKSLNSIDIVFGDSKNVRDSWADLYRFLNTENQIPKHALEEKFRILLTQMASDLGLDTTLRSDDFSRIYYLVALQEENMLKQLNRKMALEEIHARLSPSSNTNSFSS